MPGWIIIFNNRSFYMLSRKSRYTCGERVRSGSSNVETAVHVSIKINIMNDQVLPLKQALISFL